MTDFDDDFDLYPYIKNLFDHWMLILSLAVLSAIAGFAFAYLQEETYSTTATIVSTYHRPVLTLSEEFLTVSDEKIDNNDRAKAYIAIVESDAVAQATYLSVYEQLPDDIEFPKFKNLVEVTEQGDAIMITATHKDATAAALIANTWAVEATRRIENTYNGLVPLEDIQVQLEEAETIYAEAQDDLEAFIRTNQIASLERRIQEEQQVIEILQGSQVQVIDTHLQTQIGLLSHQSNIYFSTLVDHTDAVFVNQVEEQTKLFSYYYNRRTQLEKLLVEAEALYEQINKDNQSNPGDLGDAIASFLARSQAFGFGDEINFEITVSDLTSLQDTSLNYAKDVSQIIEQLETEISKAEDQIQILTDSLNAGGAYEYYEVPSIENPLFVNGMAGLDSIMQLDLPTTIVPDYVDTPLFVQIEKTSQEIQNLKAELASENNLHDRLQLQRDLAKTAYRTLLEKETEVQTVVASTNGVALVGPAIEPSDPDSKSALQITAIAGFFGGALGVGWVFLSGWWKSAGKQE